MEGDLFSVHTHTRTQLVILYRYTYVLTQKSDPVWGSQSVNQYSEVGLMKRISDTHKLCTVLHTSSQSFVPAQLATDNTVTPVLVLGGLQGGGVRIQVRGTFGFV